VPPLIRVKLLLNDSLEITGIYDSGANVSLINTKLLRIKQNKTTDPHIVNLKTINGIKETQGMVSMKVKIYDIEKTMDIFVVDNENFNNDFLIGLDLIKAFKLIQNEDLSITQLTFPKENENYSTQDENPSNTEFLNEKGTAYSEIVKKKINLIDGYKVNFNEYICVDDFDVSMDHLDLNQRSEITRLIEKYKSIFAKDKYDVGIVQDFEAHIDLTTEKYCSKRPYRCTVEDRNEIEAQIAKLLEKK
jgi:hypothetical protein